MTKSDKIHWARLDLGGSVFGLIFVVLSLTPSLLPRPAWGQGVASGISFAVGYGIGVLVMKLLRKLITWRPSNMKVARWWAVIGAWLVLLVIFVPRAFVWQNSVRETVGIAPISSPRWGIYLVVTVVVAMLFITIGRGTRTLFYKVSAWTLPWFGVKDGDRSRASFGVKTLSAAGFIVVFVVGLSIVVSLGVGVMDLYYKNRNNSVPDDIVQPISPLRTTGEGSPIAWDTVGRAGTEFLGYGPDAARIEAVTGQPAIEPIRVYIGLNSGGTYESRAQLAVDELERTGAADRAVLMLAAPTGTGWVDAAPLDGLEYLHGGDTAIVATQYSYTSSGTSAIFTPDKPRDGTKATYEAVHAWWSELPADDRPQFVINGLSLGSFALNSVFENEQELLSGVQGAVLAGTPSITPLWNGIQADRDAGSPVTLPILDEGLHVRWGAQQGDLASPAGPWEPTQVAYLQHGTDPVVWVGPSILWEEPEWLKEGQRSPDVSPHMQYIYGVTPFQGLVDLAVSLDYPEDNGHKYGHLAVEALRDITGDDGISDEAYDTIIKAVSVYDLRSTLAN